MVRTKDKMKLLGFVSPAYTPGRWSTFEFQADFQFDAMSSHWLGQLSNSLNHFENLTKSSLVTEEIIIVPQMKSDQTKPNASEKSYHIKVTLLTNIACNMMSPGKNIY